MSNYSTTKNSIVRDIRANGNQEITGQLMQDNLIRIVNAVAQGDLFAGFATPTTIVANFDANVFYIATVKGLYPNFGGLTVEDEMCVFSNRSGVWQKTSIGVATGDIVAGYNTRLTSVEGKTVQLEQEVNIKEDSSGIKITRGKNLYNKDSKYNIQGCYLNTNGSISANTNYVVTHYIDVDGISKVSIRGYGSSAASNVFYDADFNVIGYSASNITPMIIPTGCKYIRCSLYNADQYFQIEIGDVSTSYEPYKPTVSINGLALPDEIIDTPKIKAGAVTTNKFEKLFRDSFELSANNMTVEDRGISNYQYLDQVYNGWGTIFGIKSDTMLNGIQIVPTSKNSPLVLISIEEVLIPIPSEEFVGISPTNKRLIYQEDITDKWNNRYKQIVNILFSSNVALQAGKNYAISFISDDANIGFAVYTGQTHSLRVRDYYIGQKASSGAWYLSLSGLSARNIFINFITGVTNKLYKPIYEKPFILPEITEENCSFFTSYNLCKVEENVSGKYLGAGGGLSTNPSYFTTGFMEVVGGKSYSATYLSNGGGSVNCLYDETKTFIGDLFGNTTGTITIPTEVNGKIPKFIRCSVNLISAIDKYVFTEFVDEGYKPYLKTKLIPEVLPSTTTDEFLLWLPTEICIATDRTIELYNNQVSWCGNINNYHFNWTGVGKNMKRKWSCKGLASLVGQSKTLTCTVYDNNMRLVAQKSCTVKFVKNTISAETKIVPLGDSLTNSKPWISEVVTLSNSKIKFTGTRNPSGEAAGLAHEGRSGGVARFFLAENEYTYENNGKDGLDGRDKKWNPMWNPNTSTFDLNYYKANYGISFNCMQIFFGTNGISIDPTAAVAEITTLITKIREFEPTMKIFVVNTLFRGDQNGIGNGGATDGYVNNPAWKLQEDRKVFNLQVALTDACNTLANVHMIPVSVTHDSEFNFGSVDTPVNPRALNTELLPTEATHPQLQGYQQFADIIFSTYCAYIQ